MTNRILLCFILSAAITTIIIVQVDAQKPLLQFTPQRKPKSNPIKNEKCNEWTRKLESTWSQAESDWDDVIRDIEDIQRSSRLPQMSSIDDTLDQTYNAMDKIDYLHEFHRECRSDGCTRSAQSDQWRDILTKTQDFSTKFADYADYVQKELDGGRRSSSRRWDFPNAEQSMRLLRDLKDHYQQCIKNVAGGQTTDDPDLIDDGALDILYYIVEDELQPKGETMPREIRENLDELRIPEYLQWMGQKGIKINTDQYEALEEIKNEGKIGSNMWRLIKDYHDNQSNSSGGRDRLSREARNLIEDVIGMSSLPRSLESALDRGNYRDLGTYLRRESKLITADQLSTARSLERGGTLPRDLLKELEDHFDNQSLSEAAVDEIETFTGERLPYRIRDKLKNEGDIDGVIEWLKDNRVSVPRSRLDTLTSRARTVKIPSSYVDKLRNWFDRDMAQASGINREGIRALESFVDSRRIPTSVSTPLKTGDLKPFFDWVDRSRIRTGSLTRLQRDFDSAGVPRKYYDQIKRWVGTKSSLKISSSQVRALQSFVGSRNRFTSSLERELKSTGDLDSMFRWIERERIDIPRSGLVQLKRALSTSDYQKVEDWYDRYTRGGRGLDKEAIDALRTFSGQRSIPTTYRRQLERGELDNFLEWTEAANKQYGIDKSKMLSLERRLRSLRVDRGTIDKINRWWEDKFNSSPRGIPESGGGIDAVAQYSGVRTLSYSVERDLISGRLDSYFRWMEDNVKSGNGPALTDSDLTKLTSKLRSLRVSDDIIRRFDDWHAQNSRRRRLSSASVDALDRYLDGAGIRLPFSQRQELENGEIDKVLDWARIEKQRKEAERWTQLRDELRRQGVSADVIEKFEDFHSSGSGSGSTRRPPSGRRTTTTARPPSSSRIDTNTVRALGRLTQKRTIDARTVSLIKSGDIAAFFNWVRSNRLAVPVSRREGVIFKSRCRTGAYNKAACDAVTREYNF